MGMRNLEFTNRVMSLGQPRDPAPDKTERLTLRNGFHANIRARFDTLTPREKEVLNLIAGHSPSLASKQIATELGISFRTVHHHRANVMEKMGVASVAELISVILKAGIYR